jgi:hypothetical protein
MTRERYVSVVLRDETGEYPMAALWCQWSMGSEQRSSGPILGPHPVLRDDLWAMQAARLDWQLETLGYTRDTEWEQTRDGAVAWISPIHASAREQDSSRAG